METKQVIVVRKDLNMRKGKMVAQGAHASMKAILDEGYFETPDLGLPLFVIPMTEAVQAWLTGLFTKICVGVNSLDELIDIYQQALDAEIACSLVLDSGLTEFKEPTYTAVAVGPAPNEVVDKITGHLKLL